MILSSGVNHCQLGPINDANHSPAQFLAVGLPRREIAPPSDTCHLPPLAEAAATYTWSVPDASEVYAIQCPFGEMRKWLGDDQGGLAGAIQGQ